jgi:hypothetical protein
MKKIFLLSVLPALLMVSCRTEEGKTDATTPDAAKTEAPATGTPAFDVKNATSLVGQKLDDVKPALDAAEIRYRVIELDGEPMVMTMDYLPERLNFKIKGGVITEVSKG